VKLPAGVSATELAIKAAERGVLIEPGDVFFQTENSDEHFIRLGFQSISAGVIDAGIAALAGVIKALHPPRH
jgi:GntR family transcriptional regulator/MocR family aminotransferase